MSIISNPKTGTEIDTDALVDCPIFTLAAIVRSDWRKADGTPSVYFGAVPYLDAMFSLNRDDDKYGADDAKTILIYFKSNAATWRGPVAKAVKAEIARRLA